MSNASLRLITLSLCSGPAHVRILQRRINTSVGCVRSAESAREDERDRRGQMTVVKRVYAAAASDEISRNKRNLGKKGGRGALMRLSAGFRELLARDERCRACRWVIWWTARWMLLFYGLLVIIHGGVLYAEFCGMFDVSCWSIYETWLDCRHNRLVLKLFP